MKLSRKHDFSPLSFDWFQARLKVKLVAKSSQTTVTLQQAFNEMHRLQTEVITLRQELELAKEDNKRLQNRLSLLGPIIKSTVPYTFCKYGCTE